MEVSVNVSCARKHNIMHRVINVVRNGLDLDQFSLIMLISAPALQLAQESYCYTLGVRVDVDVRMQM